ncbi:TerB family tellurite resistance protein [Cerasicoccus frondis]|uniref:tellurite resistance TerB family protein n=1 Tax=Cerasicoccus frondis TaxID=490090 RepID=UPI0028526D4E|nr:TerB family tellurite resistance protein [Cerasicoccus frondis]
MSHNKQLSLILGKTLFAAAWADGKIQPQEIDCLKDIIFHLPGIDDNSWKELEHYMGSKITADERQELLSELHDLVDSDADRDFITQATNRVFMADGVITTEEQQAIREVSYVLRKESDKIDLDGLSDAIRESLKRRDHAIRKSLKPEEITKLGQGDRLQLLIILEERFAEQNIDLDISQQEKQRLILFGALLARVANADDEVAPSEIEVIENAVASRWNLSTQEAAFLTQIAFSEEAQGVDLLRLAREFYEVTTQKERMDALGVLIDVSRADEVIRHIESVTIHEIAEQLKLSQEDISDAMVDALTREQDK